MNFSEGLTELNTLLGDTDNFIFSPDQKTQFLTNAWNDTWVAVPVWDNSITYSTGTFEYPVPTSTITAVGDVYLQRTSTDNPEPIGNELWSYESVAGVPSIIFNRRAEAALANSYQLFLKGRLKLKTTDDLPTADLQNYVIALAGYMSLRNLAYQRVIKFLRNKTTLGEIVTLRRELQADVANWRSQLQTAYESA